MSLKYWTILKETKECVLDSYECTLDEFDKILEAELTLENVQTSGWTDLDSVQFKLAWDQTTDASNRVGGVLTSIDDSNLNSYDVLQFDMLWSAREGGGWTCTDGNIPPSSSGAKPSIITDLVETDDE